MWNDPGRGVGRGHSKLAREFRQIAAIALPLILGAVAAGCKPGRDADAAATVNGRAIALAEVDRACEREETQTAQIPLSQQRDLCRLSALDRLIDDEILQQQAEKLKIAATEDDIDSKLIELKALSTSEEFDEHLKRQGVTLQEFRREVGRTQSQERLFNKEINSKITVTDADIAGYYHAHLSEFDLPELCFRLARIVVNANPDPAKAVRKAESLIDMLQSGENFATVAEQFSEDPETANSGGEMPLVTESALKGNPEVYGAIVSRHPGQFTQPIALRERPGSTAVSSYVIVKFLETETGGQHNLDDPRVQQSIRVGLRQRRAQLLRVAYLESLRNGARVQNYLAEDFFENHPNGQ
jgi:peptidyl-prolyl cis-trans isomerase SurA